VCNSKGPIIIWELDDSTVYFEAEIYAFKYKSRDLRSSKRLSSTLKGYS
jgi:hypothetical protein